MGSPAEGDMERELFRTLLDHSNDSVFVIDPETGNLLDVNGTACRRLGYEREELLGLSVLDIEAKLTDSEAWPSHVENVRTKGTETFDGRHERKDGTTYPAEVSVTHVELDRAYMVAIARDVTEQRERERKLEQYRTLTQAANDAIVTINDDSTIRSANPAIEDIFGYEPEELIGECLTVLMPEELQQQHLAALGQYLETGERTLDWNYVQLPGRCRDGSEIPLAISFGEVSFEGEHFFIGIIRDITDRKEYERKLEESNERLEQFAYAVSHDLQEPLRMVSSYLRLVKQRYADELDEDGQEFIDFAVDGAERMRDMIQGLLQYSRVETQGDSFESVDLDEIVADARDDLQLRIEETDAAITTESLPTVEGDADQLRQVFQNLLDNAIEYSGDDPPRVHIEAERDGSQWVISVHDEGIGIDPESADRIFRIFERLHTHEQHSGTGIGLALCQRIVERHGGSIWVESEPDEGSTFSFTLPVNSLRSP